MRAVVLGVFAAVVLGIVAIAAFLGSSSPNLGDLEEAGALESDTPAENPRDSLSASAFAPAARAATPLAGRDELDARLVMLERSLDDLRDRIDALESRRTEASPARASQASLDDDLVAGHRAAIVEVVESVLVERDFEQEAQRVRGLASSLARTHSIEAGPLAGDLLLWRRDCFDLTLGACARGVWPSRGTAARQALDQGIERRTQDLGVLLTSRYGEHVSRRVVQYVRARTPLTEEQQPKR